MPVAGPAVIWSFVFAGVVAGLTAICYAELASAVPVSGSSYSYAYATLGEGVAMVVAACLLLEYGVVRPPRSRSAGRSTSTSCSTTCSASRSPSRSRTRPSRAACINLPAVILIGLCALLLIRGASESAQVNTVMVLIKLGVLLLFVVLGLQGWNSDNLSDFAPFGFNGITSAAGIIFFSYIGLDAVSTAGEEVKQPAADDAARDHHRAVTVTTIYIAVAVVAVAAQPTADFEGQEAGLSAILEEVTGVDLAGHRARRRRRDLDLQRHAGRDLRPDADPVRDGPRRDDPAALPPAQPAHADPGAGDAHRRRGRSRCSPACCRSTSWPR